jgi:Cu2+-exporting ATPase
LKELNIEVKDERIKKLQEEGKTVIFVVAGKKLAGVFALADKIRQESRQAIKKT